MAKKKPKSMKGCTKGRKYWHCPVKPALRVDPKSIRTVKRGKNLIRVACPVGKWRPSAPRGKQCKVGMVSISVLKPV